MIDPIVYRLPTYRKLTPLFTMEMAEYKYPQQQKSLYAHLIKTCANLRNVTLLNSSITIFLKFHCAPSSLASFKTCSFLWESAAKQCKKCT